MSTNSLREILKGAICRDRDHALAFFLWAFLKYEPEHLRQNAEWFGLNERMLNDVETTVKNTLEQLRLTYDFKISEEITRAAADCLENFSLEFEKITKERVSKLTDLERRVLRHASLWMRNMKTTHYLFNDDKKVFIAESIDTNELVDSLCVVLKADYSQIYGLVYRILAQTGLAFAYISGSSRHTYYSIIIPRYALSIIEELAVEAEKELQNVTERLHNLNSMQLAAIAGGFFEADNTFYNVYGISHFEYLQSLNIEGVCYKGYVNYSLKGLITNFLIEMVNERCQRLYNRLYKVLKDQGYELDIVDKADNKHLYCRIKAVKPGQHAVIIYIEPFAYKLPFLYEKSVLVFEGPIAKPEEFKNVVVVGMSEGFGGVKVVVDNAGTSWSKDMVEAFNRLSLQPMPSEPSVQAKPAEELSWEDLEEAVVDVLERLGFRGIFGRRPDRDVKLDARGGGKIEVDVWGWKQVGSTRLNIYVSCKNWNRDVDRSVVDEEFGRTLQLNEIPQIKVIVAKRFTDTAKKVAQADGFIVIELGDVSTVDEARNLIYKQLRDFFTGIAPPDLQRLANEVKQITDKLRSIADEMEKLSAYYS
ncbi:restriction endonuclease [Vulcanisaeta thermophila]|uniref:restriction endonuclease n=1 Tax=Vulcanisaeta thermophila TaxID=867917 RepID=UPI000852CEE3|nr:restriction endonuclease [Vulcanisaeta thermophila]